MTRHKWDQVTVVGCGLIGSSFALALRRRGACERIVGWDFSASALQEALEAGAIDATDQNLAAGEVSASDLVYLAMPVLEIVRFLREHGSQIRQGAIITDAGGTKTLICRAADHLPAGHHFIGGHPIAGSHLSGAAHALADLFEDATYVLTTDNAASGSEPFIALRETIESLGARVKLMTAADHDRALALVSHLPQMVSSALAAAVEEQAGRHELATLAGPGYHDMTRLAASSWTIWRDILLSNPTNIVSAIDAFMEKLCAARDELHRSGSDLDAELPAAQTLFNKQKSEVN